MERCTLKNHCVCINHRFSMYKDKECGFLCNTNMSTIFKHMDVIFHSFPIIIIYGDMTLEFNKPYIGSQITSPKIHFSLKNLNPFI